MTHRSRLLVASATVIPAIGLFITSCNPSLASTVSADTTPRYHRYVALGDSYASGPRIKHSPAGTPAGCLRSDHNYASDLARDLGVGTFIDVTCGNAQTRDMTSDQAVPHGTNPAQFDALTEDTDLVTITIGGNDIGFTSIVRTCTERALSHPSGNPCQQYYATNGEDQLAARIDAAAPKVASVLAGIRQHAPTATIVVVGYLNLLPTVWNRGCFIQAPFASGDIPYLHGIEQRLNAMLANRAAAAHDMFVDAGLPSGHDICQRSSVKWVEGAVPASPAAPMHPNATGMAAVSQMVLDSIS